jgi:hypothetical protein
LAAQKGDRFAGDTLIRQHEFWIRYHIKHRKHPDHAEELQIGLLALWRAVLNWKPGYGGLNAYFRPYFDGALTDFRRERRNDAGFSSSRIQEYLRTQRHWELSADRIKEEFPVWHLRTYGTEAARSYTARDIEEEKSATRMFFRPVVGLHEHYNHHGGLTGGVHFADPDAGDTKALDIDGKISRGSDGIRRQRAEKVVHSVSQHSRRVTKVDWLGALKTEQRDRIYPTPVADRRPPEVCYPLMWGHDASQLRTGWVDDKDWRGLGEGASSIRSCAVVPLAELRAAQPAYNAQWGSYWSERSLSRSLRDSRSLNRPRTATTRIRDIMTENLENDFNTETKDYRKPQTCPRCGTTFYKPPGATIHCGSECPKLRTVTIHGKEEKVA